MSLISEQAPGRVADLRVTNSNGRGIQIAWTGVTGATGYRITWRRGNGWCRGKLLSFFTTSLFTVLVLKLFFFRFSGAEQSRVVGAQTTGFTIAGQQPEEGLVIGVAALVDQRMGEVATLSPRPNVLSESVSGLRVVGISSRRIRVVWSPTYRATGYKVTWRHENGRKWYKLFRKCYRAFS